MDKVTVIVGFPILSKLVRGRTVELSDLVLIPDDQLFNEAHNNGSCVPMDVPTSEKEEAASSTSSNSHYTTALCKRCPYGSECKAGEKPGSNHCFAVLQRLNPLEAADCV